MKEKRLIEILGEPSPTNGNWSRELTERDVKILNRDIKIYQLMLKRKSPHLNIYGLHVHLANRYVAGPFADNKEYDDYAKDEILPYLTGIIETCKSILKIGWLPFMYKCTGSGVIFNANMFETKNITMLISFNHKDVRYRLPAFCGAHGIFGAINKFDCNYCISCEQYRAVPEGLAHIHQYIDEAFKQHNVGGFKIKDIEKYQRRYWFEYDKNVINRYLLYNAEFIDGCLRKTFRLKHPDRFGRDEIVLTIVVYGDAKNITGDAENIFGKIPDALYGDVSGLSGDISYVSGDATGVELNIDLYRKRRLLRSDVIINLDEITASKFPALSNRYKTLSYKDNTILMKAWRTFCYHTIGLEKDVYDKFDNPVKVKPPFPVDKWGRHYEESGDTMRIYSVNPADIMLAKDVNKCATCFCLNSGTRRWPQGMRCLIAEASVNPNLGVVLEFRKKDMTKKLNQFKGVKFRWFDPDKASFFQYTSKHAGCFLSYKNHDLLPCFDGAVGRGNVVPIYGHDGICNAQEERQKKLAYLETFIKPEYKWYNGDKPEFPLVNNYQNFYKSEISDEWKEQIKRANNMADELRALIGTDKGDK